MKSRAYECEICGMVFVNSRELSEHQTNVHIRKMYQCQSCNQVFSSKQHFEKHEAQAHSATANLNSLSVNESSKHRREQGMESHQTKWWSKKGLTKEAVGRIGNHIKHIILKQFDTFDLNRTWKRVTMCWFEWCIRAYYTICCFWADDFPIIFWKDASADTANGPMSLDDFQRGLARSCV